MEWRNSGMDITINLHIMEIYALQGHVHGNLCLARECYGNLCLARECYGNLCLARV